MSTYHTDEDTARWREGEGRKVSRWLAWRLLRLIEWLLLRAYGWIRTEQPAASEQAWTAPPGHPKAGEHYGYNHAINSTRYYAAPGLPPRGRGRSRRR